MNRGDSMHIFSIVYGFGMIPSTFFFFFYQVIAFALISGIYKSCWKCWCSNHHCFQATLNVARQCLNLPAKLHLTVFQAGEVIFALHMSMLINHRCHVAARGFIGDWVKADNILGRRASSFVFLCFRESSETLCRFIKPLLLCRNLSLESSLIEIEMTQRWRG